jgi:hypothetical protein
MTKAVQARLDELAGRSGGLTVATVLKDARNPKSPLHTEIDWDKERNYQAGLKEQARELIRRYTVSYVKGERKFQKYIYNPRTHQRESVVQALDSAQVASNIAITLHDELVNFANRNAAYFKMFPNLKKASWMLDQLIDEFKTVSKTISAAATTKPLKTTPKTTRKKVA